MKVKFGGGIVAARGSIAGNVYSANASGAYVRAFAMPTNPDTSAQQQVRSLFGGISNSWKGLSQENQDSWIAAAPNWPVQDSLGQEVILTGQQLFCRLNNSLLQVGEDTIDTAPNPVELTDIVAVSADSIEDAALVFDVDWSGDGTTVPANQALLVEATVSMSAGVNAPKRPAFKQIAVEAASSSTANLNITTDYEARFGTPQIGAKVFVRFTTINTDTGQRGQSFQIGGVVSATP